MELDAEEDGGAAGPSAGPTRGRAPAGPSPGPPPPSPLPRLLDPRIKPFGLAHGTQICVSELRVEVLRELRDAAAIKRLRGEVGGEGWVRWLP